MSTYEQMPYSRRVHTFAEIVRSTDAPSGGGRRLDQSETDDGAITFIGRLGALGNAPPTYYQRAGGSGAAAETLTEGSILHYIAEMQSRSWHERVSIATAIDDEVGLFLLQKAASSDSGLILDELDRNLNGYRGWLPLSRLLAASLLAENGRTVYLTPKGQAALAALHGIVEDGL